MGDLVMKSQAKQPILRNVLHLLLFQKKGEKSLQHVDGGGVTKYGPKKVDSRSIG